MGSVVVVCIVVVWKERHHGKVEPSKVPDELDANEHKGNPKEDASHNSGCSGLAHRHEY